MRMLSFLTSGAVLLGLLTNCTDKTVLLPTTPVVTTPVSQTIINPAPLPVAEALEKPLEGWLHPMAYASLITGKTDYISGLRAEVLTQVTSGVDLGSLVKPGQPLRMIALGGSLTAGVRNGGLYREGQLTAYPNLVARQMGIADFQSPTFGPLEANGTGFLLYDEQATTYPRWREVANQKAVVLGGDPPVLSSYVGKLDNYAVPTMQGPGFNMPYYPGGTGVTSLGKTWFRFQPYLWRFLPSQQNERAGLVDHIAQNQGFDLFFLEEKAETWLMALRDNNNLSYTDFLYDLTVGVFDYGTIAAKLAKGGKKGVIFTVPNVLDYAFMHWYPTADLKQKASSISITYRYPERKVNAASNFFMMPTANVAKLFEGLKQGQTIDAVLTDADVMDQIEAGSTDPYLYNLEVVKLAKKYNLALVDLNAIYKQIQQGNYTTEDGLKIDGSPKGNFFSSDGTYPTAIGQAVIANEVIKSLNSTYRSRIPLINVQDFSATTSAK